jgi:hypothetical protein
MVESLDIGDTSTILFFDASSLRLILKGAHSPSHIAAMA